MSPLKRELLIWMQETNNFLKLLGVERDLDGKLQGVNDNAKSLVTKLNSLDNDTKNNSQQLSTSKSLFAYKQSK